MSDIFLKIFSMSINASWLIIAVLVLRLVLKKAPKWINVLLWAVVGLRLVLPFSPESILSLLPSKEVVYTTPIVSVPEKSVINFDTGITTVNEYVNRTVTESATVTVEKSHIDFIAVISYAWLIGILAMLIYAAVSYMRLYKQVSISVLKEDNVYYCDSIQFPFIFGLFKQRIYLPSGIDEKNIEYVLRHENAHLKRKDYLFKQIAFLILSVYWFNPLVWVGYILLCRDIELACDEKVIKNEDNAFKKNYLQALLDCSLQKRKVIVCPVAFGEVSLIERVKNVVNYKKPRLWVIITSIALCVVLLVGFMTYPKTEGKKAAVSQVSPGNGDIAVDTKIENNISSETVSSEDNKTDNKNEKLKDNTLSESESANKNLSEKAEPKSQEQKEIYYSPFCTEDHGDLSEKTVNKIKEIYLQKFLQTDDNWLKKTRIEDIYITKYYGTLSDGSIALNIVNALEGGDETAVVKVEFELKYIEDYIYYSNYKNSPKIYKNGKIEDLDIAYKNKTISQKVLDEFFKKNSNLNVSGLYMNDKDNYGSLDIDSVCKIKQNYRYLLNFKHYNYYNSSFDLSELYIESYFGKTKSGYCIVSLGYTKTTGKEKTVTETVGEYQYTHLINQGFYLFKPTDNLKCGAPGVIELRGDAVTDMDKIITKTELENICKAYPEYFKK